MVALVLTEGKLLIIGTNYIGTNNLYSLYDTRTYNNIRVCTRDSLTYYTVPYRTDWLLTLFPTHHITYHSTTISTITSTSTISCLLPLHITTLSYSIILFQYQINQKYDYNGPEKIRNAEQLYSISTTDIKIEYII